VDGTICQAPCQEAVDVSFDGRKIGGQQQQERERDH
jgi:lipoate-protein ligase A